MGIRIGIDVGGTFTDFVLVKDGQIATEKYPTSPEDPSIGTLKGLDALLERHSIKLESVEQIVHGTTLVANALIERKGATVGLLMTKGFRDTLEIRREVRFDIYDLDIEFPTPLVPRQLRKEVHERTDNYGSVLSDLSEENLLQQVKDLVGQNIDSLAVCFLHSYANPLHEQRVQQLVIQNFPDLYVSISSDITPFIGEYERTSTTVINAYVQPLIHRHLAYLEKGLHARGFNGNLYLMTSAGGTITSQTAAELPVLLLESGPVAGALMSQYLGEQIGAKNLLAFDMGGTTAKGSIIKHGSLRKEYAFEVARSYKYKKGSGFPLMIPAIQLIEIGAGGGSIASVDALKRLRVGPESAGAKPGPACYKQGGTYPTVTDADLVLGYLDPDFFLGGTMTLDPNAAEQAIKQHIAEPLGINTTAAALGIHEIANENISRAFRLHTAESGVDIAGHDLVAFGGAGPIHAVRVAKRLGARNVIVPWGAGVYSAFGLLITPLGFDMVQTELKPFEELDRHILENRFQTLEVRTLEMLQRAQVNPQDVRMDRSLDIRYRGQAYTVEVSAVNLDSANIMGELRERFFAAYEELYGTLPEETPIEVLNWKVAGTGPVEPLGLKPTFQDIEITPNLERSIKNYRNIYVQEQEAFQSCPVYDRYRLRPGDQIAGPAMIEERESSLVLEHDDKGLVDDGLNIRVALGEINEEQGGK